MKIKNYIIFVYTLYIMYTHDIQYYNYLNVVLTPYLFNNFIYFMVMFTF